MGLKSSNTHTPISVFLLWQTGVWDTCQSTHWTSTDENVRWRLSVWLCISQNWGRETGRRGKMEKCVSYSVCLCYRLPSFVILSSEQSAQQCSHFATMFAMNLSGCHLALKQLLILLGQYPWELQFSPALCLARCVGMSLTLGRCLTDIFCTKHVWRDLKNPISSSLAANLKGWSLSRERLMPMGVFS